MISLVALGSSSTQGAGASSAQKSFVARIGQFLEAYWSELKIVNLGRPGGRFLDILGQWDQVEAARPGVVLVLPFTDYAKTPFARFYQECGAVLEIIGDTARDAERAGRPFGAFWGDLRIDPDYVYGQKASRGGPSYRVNDFVMLAEKNAALARLTEGRAAVHVVPVIDQNGIHPEWIAPDGHPNDLGHAYLAGCFQRVLAPWLAGVSEPDASPRPGVR